MPLVTEIIGAGRDKTPLKKIIKQNPSLTRENVKKLYGDIGIDIFDGKEKISILPKEDYKKSQSFMGKIIKWWSEGGKYDYEEKDSIKDLVLKYACNKNFGTLNEIEKNFGEEGRKVADIYKVMRYFITNKI